MAFTRQILHNNYPRLANLSVKKICQNMIYNLITLRKMVTGFFKKNLKFELRAKLFLDGI